MNKLSNYRRVIVTLSFALLVMASSIPASAATSQQSLNSFLSFPVPAGTVNGSPFNGGTFSGVLNIQSFASGQNNTVNAIGTLTGQLTDAVTNSSIPVSGAPVTLPVTSIQVSCPILSLTLGPINLNLLGLVVQLNQVVLTITAVPGAGNLLGNLLCQVASLLNSPTSTVAELVTLLNSILAAL